MSVHDIAVNTLSGEQSSLGEHAGKTLLIVNVASKCGLTPQYTALEEIYERYADRGFEVLGFPCNQFGGQEPGSAADITGPALTCRFPNCRHQTEPGCAVRAHVDPARIASYQRLRTELDQLDAELSRRR